MNIQQLADSTYQEIVSFLNGTKALNPSSPPIEFDTMSAFIKEKANALNAKDAEEFYTELFNRITLNTHCITNPDTYDIKRLERTRRLIEYLEKEYVPQFLKGEKQPILECNVFAFLQTSMSLKATPFIKNLDNLFKLSTEERKSATKLIETCHSLYEEFIKDDAVLRDKSQLLQTNIGTIKKRYPTYYANHLSVMLTTELMHTSICAGIHANMGNITASIESTTLLKSLYSFYSECYPSKKHTLPPMMKVSNEIVKRTEFLMGLKELYPLSINALTQAYRDLGIDPNSCVPCQPLQTSPTNLLSALSEDYCDLADHKSKLDELPNVIKTENLAKLQRILGFHIRFFNAIQIAPPGLELQEIIRNLGKLIGLMQGCMQHFVPSLKEDLPKTLKTAHLKKNERITSKNLVTEDLFNQMSSLKTSPSEEANLQPDGYIIPLTSYQSVHQAALKGIYHSVIQPFFPTHKGKLIATQIDFSTIKQIIKQWEIPAKNKNLYRNELAHMLQGVQPQKLEQDLIIAYGNTLKLLQYLQEEYIPQNTRLSLAPTLHRRYRLLLEHMDLIFTHIQSIQLKSRKAQESNLILDDNDVQNIASMLSSYAQNATYLSFNQIYFQALKELFTIKALLVAEYEKMPEKDKKSNALLQTELASEIKHCLEVATAIFNLGHVTKVETLIIKSATLLKEYKLQFIKAQSSPMVSELEKITLSYQAFITLHKISTEAVNACKTMCPSIKIPGLIALQSTPKKFSFDFRKDIEARDIFADTITLLALLREMQAKNVPGIKAIVVDLQDMLEAYGTANQADDIVESIPIHICTLIEYAQTMTTIIELKTPSVSESSEDDMLKMAENILITLGLAARNREPNLNLILNAQINALFDFKPNIKPDAFYPLLATTFIEFNLFKLPQGKEARIAAQEKRTMMAKTMLEVISERYLNAVFENDTPKERTLFDLSLFNAQQCQARLYDLLTDDNLLTGSLEHQSQQFLLIEPLYQHYYSLYPMLSKAISSLMKEQSWGSEKWSNIGWELLTNSIYLNLSNHNVINYAMAYLYLNLGYFKKALETLLTQAFPKVEQLKKEIHSVQTPIFMRSYQLALQQGQGLTNTPQTITCLEEKTPLHKQIASVNNDLKILLETLPEKIENYLGTLKSAKAERFKNSAKIPSLDWQHLTIEQLYYGKIKAYAGYLAEALDKCQPEALQNTLVQLKRLMEFLDKVAANSALLTNSSNTKNNEVNSIDTLLMELQRKLAAIYNQSLSCSQKNKKESQFTGMTADELLQTFNALGLSADDKEKKITPRIDNKLESSKDAVNQPAAHVFDEKAFEAARAAAIPAQINTLPISHTVNSETIIDTSAGDSAYYVNTPNKPTKLGNQSFFNKDAKKTQHWKKASKPSTTDSSLSNEEWVNRVVKQSTQPIAQHPRDYSNCIRSTENIRTWSEIVSQSEGKVQPLTPHTEVKESINDAKDKQPAANTDNTFTNNNQTDGQYPWKYKGNKNKRKSNYEAYKAMLLAYYPTGEANSYQVEFNCSLAMIHERFMQMVRDLRLSPSVPLTTYITDPIKNALWYNIENITSLTFDEYAHKMSILFHPAYGNNTCDILNTLNCLTALYPQNVELHMAMHDLALSSCTFNIFYFYTESLIGRYPPPLLNTHYVYRVITLFMVPLVIQRGNDLTLQKKCERVVVEFLKAFDLDLSAPVNKELKKELEHLLTYHTLIFENTRQYIEAISCQEQPQSTTWQKSY